MLSPETSKLKRYRGLLPSVFFALINCRSTCSRNLSSQCVSIRVSSVLGAIFGRLADMLWNKCVNCVCEFCAVPVSIILNHTGKCIHYLFYLLTWFNVCWIWSKGDLCDFAYFYMLWCRLGVWRVGFCWLDSLYSGVAHALSLVCVVDFYKKIYFHLLGQALFWHHLLRWIVNIKN